MAGRPHVLLVGIDAYDGGGSLTGCVNDIDAIQRLLIDRVLYYGSLDTFYRLDRNNDKRLTRAELGTVRGTPFNNVDTNRDGRITLSEWPYSHRSFDDQDTNGDGVVSQSEFRPDAVNAK